MFRMLEGADPTGKTMPRIPARRWWSGLTLGDLLDRAADIHPNREAFVDRRHRLTYAQVRESAERLAIGLMDLGIKPLDRVLIQLPNWTEFVSVYFACQKIGAITVMLIDRYRQHEVQRLAEISEAVAWVVPPQYGKTDFVPIVDDVRAGCPGIEHVITVRGEVDRPGFVEHGAADRGERAHPRESGPAGGARRLMHGRWPTWARPAGLRASRSSCPVTHNSIGLQRRILLKNRGINTPRTSTWSWAR